MIKQSPDSDLTLALVFFAIFLFLSHPKLQWTQVRNELQDASEKFGLCETEET